MAKKQQNIKPAGLGNKVQHYRHGLNLDFNKGIDGRTQLGKAHKMLEGYLRAYVGESNIVTELLINRISYKAIKCYLFESQDIEKQMLDDSAGTLYLSYTNSLRRDLAELDRMAVAPKENDLMTYLKENYELKSKGSNN
jgi:hypothetical protein